MKLFLCWIFFIEFICITSQVILCTDGLANVGVGSLEVDENQQNANNGDNDDDEEDDPVLKWYEALGDYAVANGVIVNIISITDDGCRLEVNIAIFVYCISEYIFCLFSICIVYHIEFG